MQLALSTHDFEPDVSRLDGICSLVRRGVRWSLTFSRQPTCRKRPLSLSLSFSFSFPSYLFFYYRLFYILLHSFPAPMSPKARRPERESRNIPKGDTQEEKCSKQQDTHRELKEPRARRRMMANDVCCTIPVHGWRRNSFISVITGSKKHPHRGRRIAYRAHLMLP